MNSILNSTKKILGITSDDTSFDSELIIHINSVFAILRQMGVGPETTYKITDATNEWDEFIQGNTDIDDVKTYVALKTKSIFDPPSSSSAMESMNRLISELEWRLNAACDFVEEET